MLTITSVFSVDAQNQYLSYCHKKQVQPLEKQSLNFSFQEKLNELEHSSEPWQQTNYSAKGKVWANANDFSKQDTLVNGTRVYYSRTSLKKGELLFLDYGDNDLYHVTKDFALNQIIKSARYNPVYLLNYFVQQNVSIDKSTNKEFAIYTNVIDKTIVKLFINKSDFLLKKITTLHHDELFGDALTVLNYSEFQKIGALYFPVRVTIDKLTGKLSDEVLISKPKLVSIVPELLNRPVDYQVKESVVEVPELTVKKFSDKIYFIELKHTDDRIMLVEFSDFFLVAEAPLNSENGELIISEARKISPKKPVKYFIFGHYHPHYLGGIRPFIHKGANIVCLKMDEEYLEYIARSPHTLNPDSLHLKTRPLKIVSIKDSLKISDGNYQMIVYFIGQKSQHTKDYLIYYFPKEKLLFEDDLVWIAKEGEMKKAGGRQAGLYNAIMDLRLNVETIVQSWPVRDYGVKTIIPFYDLEKSMNIK